MPKKHYKLVHWLRRLIVRQYPGHSSQFTRIAPFNWLGLTLLFHPQRSSGSAFLICRFSGAMHFQLDLYYFCQVSDLSCFNSSLIDPGIKHSIRSSESYSGIRCTSVYSPNGLVATVGGCCNPASTYHPVVPWGTRNGSRGVNHLEYAPQVLILTSSHPPVPNPKSFDMLLPNDYPTLSRRVPVVETSHG